MSEINGRYADIAALLAGDLPEPPEPDYLTRLDGHGLLYGEAVNSLFGEPEGGKTWLALAALAEDLRGSGRTLFMDLDHNGVRSIVGRLIMLGVPADVLSDQNRFRYTEPEDASEVIAAVADCENWKPSIVVVDSVGELVPLFRADSNSPDEYTRVHRQVATRLAKSGACVILIDHVSKSVESAKYGATGTGAKRRAIDGASLRVTVRSPFTPGKGGSAVIHVNKDRHGGVREHAHMDEGSKEPVAGIFEMGYTSERLTWKLRAPLTDERASSEPASLEDVTALARLDPEPGNIRDVKARMSWGSSRASAALKAFKAGEHLVFPVPEEQSGNKEQSQKTGVFPVPAPLPPENGEHSDQHKQSLVPQCSPTSGTTSVGEHNVCKVCGDPCRPAVRAHVECLTGTGR